MAGNSTSQLIWLELRPAENGMRATEISLKNAAGLPASPVMLAAMPQRGRSGMKWTGYADVSLDIANALNMHRAFGVEFVEVLP